METIYEYISPKGSKYIITPNGDVYRLSNHWGAVASCEWTLEGKGELCMSVFISGDWELGVANLSEFKIFRRKFDRNRDIIINPIWQEKIIKIEPVLKKLEKLKSEYIFDFLPDDDKRLIGSNVGYFTSIFKQINI
jgi:hypothetical protein